MKKVIKLVNKENNTVQVTTQDERWYTTIENNEVTGLPEVRFIPSVTWICDSYPKGIPFYKWLADKGWDEAEALKEAAGERGSKVHSAIEKLIAGFEVKIDDKFLNPKTDQEEELNADEYEAIVSFANWFNEVKPRVLANEIPIVSKEYNFAGTIDFVCEIDGKIWIVDFKTGQNTWPSHELQLSAYKNAYGQNIDGLAILQVGYKRNKAGWKWNEMEDKFDVFLATRMIWQNDHGDEKPKQKDYPMKVKLVDTKSEEIKTEVKTKKSIKK